MTVVNNNNKILAITGAVISVAFVATAAWLICGDLQDDDGLRMAAKIIVAIAIASIGVGALIRGLRQGALSVEITKDCVIVQRLLWRDVVCVKSIIEIGIIAKTQKLPTVIHIKYSDASRVKEIEVRGPALFLVSIFDAIKSVDDADVASNTA